MHTEIGTPVISDRMLDEVEGIFASVYDMPVEQRLFHAAMYQDVILGDQNLFDALGLMTDESLTYEDVLAQASKSMYHQMGAVLHEAYGRAVGLALLSQKSLEFHAASLLCLRSDITDDDIHALKQTESGELALFARRRLDDQETMNVFVKNPESIYLAAKRWDSIPSACGSIILKQLIASFNELHTLPTRVSCPHFATCTRASTRPSCAKCWPVREHAALCLTAAQKVKDDAAPGYFAHVFFLIPFKDLPITWMADVFQFFASVSLEVPCNYATKVIEHYLRPYFCVSQTPETKTESSVAEREDIKEGKNAYLTLASTICALNVPNAIYWTKVIQFLADAVPLRAFLPEFGKTIQDNEAFPRKLSGELRDLIIKSL